MSDRNHCTRALWGCHHPNACTCNCVGCRPTSSVTPDLTLAQALRGLATEMTGVCGGLPLPVDNPAFVAVWSALRDARRQINALAGAAERFESIELVYTDAGLLDFAPAGDGDAWPTCDRCSKRLDFVGELRSWRCSNPECPRCVAARRRQTIVVPRARTRHRAWPWQGRGR